MSVIRTSKKNGTRYSRICFTLNNYTDVEYKDLTDFLSSTMKWGIIAKEVGENGTPHLQAAVVFGKQVAFSTIRKFPGFARVHFEAMHGTPEDSVVYCTKEDANPFTWGKLPEPGKRNDIAEACAAILGGSTMRDLARTHGPSVVKFARGFQNYKTLIQEPRDVSEPPTIYWLYGPTGTGKTKCAWEFAEKLFPSSVWTSHDGLNWFDGYDGQSAVIIDDFRPKGIRFSFFLRILDRYPISVPFKGGFVQWLPKLIIITTPNDICTTFSKRSEHIPEDLEQLARRLTSRFYFPDDKEKFLDLLRDYESSSSSYSSLSEPSHVDDTQLLSESDVFGEDDAMCGGDGTRESVVSVSLGSSSLSSSE